MAEVHVDVGGRGYRLICGDGEEQALQTAAAYLDNKAQTLLQTLGAISEGRLLLMSALVVVGELLTLRREAGSQGPTDAEEARLAAMIARVEDLAQRLENNGTDD